MNDYIEIVGAKENNLKNINLKIPKEKITVFTGVSGSGKSSIVFDTIAQESGRLLNETYSSFARRYLPKYKRPKVDSLKNISPTITIDQKRLGGNARSTLGTVSEINSVLRVLYSRFASPSAGFANAYSFNDPEGMCPKCEGIGKVITVIIDNALDKEKSLEEGAILLPNFNVGSYYYKLYAEIGLFDPSKKIKDYTEEEYEMLLYGEAQKVTVNFGTETMGSTYMGLVDRFMRNNVNKEGDTTKAREKQLTQFTEIVECGSCNGKRYNEAVLNSKIQNYNIYDLTSMELKKLLVTLQSINLVGGEPIINDIIQRVQSLCDIGLSYLTLTRETETLSGGESQRVKMVKNLGSNLNGLVYIFDEPSTGLHPYDVHRLNELLKQLRNKGNTVIIVEHDEDVMPIADYIVEVGPGAGRNGGNIMYFGDYDNFLKSDVLTAKCLNHKMNINTNHKVATEFYETQPSTVNNLKNESLKIPNGIFTVVTGVAGSGKSTLVNKVFAKTFECISIDQSPLHATSRSNSATYLGIMDDIRNLFAKENNVDKGLFSYNSKGACEHCKGTGVIILNMSFMDNVEVECSHCDGNRFKEDVLEYKYKDNNIVDIMTMTVEDAISFFDSKKITNKLKDLNEVGLGYLTLGQSLDTLSGGESQRLKLAKELRATGNIYILDEPTVGLHMNDVKIVINIINNLVHKGNTVIVIEHNLDIIRNADWIVDIGPYGGTDGGEIIFEGYVDEIKQCQESITGKYL